MYFLIIKLILLMVLQTIGGQGSITVILSICAVFYLVSTVEAGSGSCPQVSKVYSCSPKCEQDYDCSHGKKCCPNSCHAKSCSEPAANGSGGGDKYSQTGSGIYCGNVKCNAYEKCITDPSTKRQKCGRS